MDYNRFAKNTAFSVFFCLQKACNDPGLINPAVPVQISVRFCFIRPKKNQIRSYFSWHVKWLQSMPMRPSLMWLTA